LIFPTLFLMHRMLMRSSRELLWSLSLFCLLLFGLLLSFSRGAWMDFIAASAVFLFLWLAPAPPAHRRRLRCFVLVRRLFAVGAVVAALSIEQVRSVFLMRLAIAQDYDSSEGGRFDSMSQAFQMALTYPLGIGPQHWQHIFDLEPHNVYVNYFVSGGFISLGG